MTKRQPLFYSLSVLTLLCWAWLFWQTGSHWWWAMPMETLAVMALPAVAVGLAWYGSRQGPRLSVYQQQRQSEKVAIAHEQALMKIDALEAKIQTLETALTKVLQQNKPQ